MFNTFLMRQSLSSSNTLRLIGNAFVLVTFNRSDYDVIVKMSYINNISVNYEKIHIESGRWVSINYKRDKS